MFVDHKLIDEPIENPEDYPHTLTCGEEVWKRGGIYQVAGPVAFYQNEQYPWAVAVSQCEASKGYWVMSPKGPVILDACKTFGTAVAIIRGRFNR